VCDRKPSGFREFSISRIHGSTGWSPSGSWNWQALQEFDYGERLSVWDGQGDPPPALNPALDAPYHTWREEELDRRQAAIAYDAAYAKLYAKLEALPQLFIAV
jgi:hypothetical protein